MRATVTFMMDVVSMAAWWFGGCRATVVKVRMEWQPRTKRVILLMGCAILFVKRDRYGTIALDSSAFVLLVCHSLVVPVHWYVYRQTDKRKSSLFSNKGSKLRFNDMQEIPKETRHALSSGLHLCRDNLLRIIKTTAIPDINIH